MSTSSSRALLEAFFTHGEPRCSGSNGDDVSDSAIDAPGSCSTAATSSIVYLHGPTRAGQTSLLLQFAFTQARREQHVVLVLCGDGGATNNSTFTPISPCLACGMPTQTGSNTFVLQRIQIKYLRTSKELQHFLCSLHLVTTKSSVLLIDGLEQFFSDDSALGHVYQTLAYLFETRQFMQTATGAGHVVVTGTSDSFILQHTTRHALRRWCTFLRVQATDDPSEFVLSDELEATSDCEDDDASEDDNDAQQIQIRYEYSPPTARQDGVFRLLRIEAAIV